jgi:hypothetical protein
MTGRAKAIITGFKCTHSSAITTPREVLQIGNAKANVTEIMMGPKAGD